MADELHIIEKLAEITRIKEEIRLAINEKGTDLNVLEPFRIYPDRILAPGYIKERDYLTFSRTDSSSSSYFSLSLENFGGNAPIIYYSKNGGDYTLWDYSAIIIGIEDTIKMYGDNSFGFSKSNTIYSKFEMNGPLKVSGNCDSLRSNLKINVATPYCFYKLFYNCPIISCPELPALEAGVSCYESIFEGCNRITETNNFPATNLRTRCYARMFANCSNLSNIANLSANTLAKECYTEMFEGCSNLVNSIELSAANLASGCYKGMFKNCTRLIECSELNATTMFEGCYANMFQGCNSIKDTCDLLSETLAKDCYKNMFANCANLLNISRLPAATLFAGCYEGMFINCISLENPVELPATTLADNCYKNMFSGCTALTSTPELPATVLYRSCYENMFVGDTALSVANNISAISIAEASCKGMFSGCTSLNIGPELLITEIVGTNIGAACCKEMFKNCTSLTTGFVPLLNGEAPRECYMSMFENCSNLTTVSDLPAITLYRDCYNSMFKGCTSLVNTPNMLFNSFALQTNSQCCCKSMFEGCTSLINTSPLLPTTLEYLAGNYQRMFAGCIALVNTPRIYANNFGSNGCNQMFIGCTSLTTVNFESTTISNAGATSMFEDCVSLVNISELTFTGVASDAINGGCARMFYNCKLLNVTPIISGERASSHAYVQMFYGCSSLVTAPQLPATNLSDGCYASMFAGCSSLVNAPQLPATTLSASCYANMFVSCTSLINAPELPATTLKYECYAGMFTGCTSLTSAPELPAENVGSRAYDNMFNGCTSLIYIKTLALTGINDTNCYNWVKNVASSGVFIMDPAARWHVEFRDSCIPVGWRVEGLPGPDYEWTESEYLTFTANGNNCSLAINNINNSPQIYYKKNNTDFQLWDYSPISLNSGDIVKMYGENGVQFNKGTNSYSSFIINGNIGASGQCNSLLSKTKLYGVGAYCFYKLFDGCATLASAPELYALVLDEGCYSYMFRSCISLIQAPVLPASILAEKCYEGMLSECIALTTAPDLIAETLVASCYDIMFKGCTNLNSVKALFLTAPGLGYTDSWLDNVASVGTFIKNQNATWDDTIRSINTIPNGWTVQTA